MIALLLTTFALADDSEPVGIRTGAGTGFVVGRGHGALGLFRPVSVGISEKTEVGTTGLVSLIAPRVLVKHQLAGDETWALAATGSLGVPTGGIAVMRTAGILTTDPEVRTPLAVTASVGVAGGARLPFMDIGLSVEGRLGARGSSWNLDAPGMWFLDPMMAPLTEGPQLKTRLVFDVAPEMNGRERLGIRADTWVQVGSGGPDAALRLMATWAFAPRWALALGEALAFEQRQGRALYAVPIGDLQYRW